MVDVKGLKRKLGDLIAVFELIEGWYNSRRRHSALDMMSPIEYESSILGVAPDTSPNLSIETGQFHAYEGATACEEERSQLRVWRFV